MLTEFDVRNELSEIDGSDAHPIRKARQLIAVANRVRRQAYRLTEGARILSRDGNDEQAERLNLRKLRMHDLAHEILAHARTHLASSQRSAAQPETHAVRYVS
ncbi:MAG: hypothetical protein U0R49_11355 [Fimbriimonadales bacterium]